MKYYSILGFLVFTGLAHAQQGGGTSGDPGPTIYTYTCGTHKLRVYRNDPKRVTDSDITIDGKKLTTNAEYYSKGLFFHRENSTGGWFNVLLSWNLLKGLSGEMIYDVGTREQNLQCKPSQPSWKDIGARG